MRPMRVHSRPKLLGGACLALAAGVLLAAAAEAHAGGIARSFALEPRKGTLTPITPSHAALAAYWAPVVCQDMDDDNYRAEYITRFDYDGDWRSNNNWDNLYDHALPAAVYYWVSETETHYFIGYAFFHPRDWSDGPGGWFGFDEHENDLEGVLLTIRKQSLYGQFVSMVTVAHWDFYSYTDRDTPSWSPWYGQVAASRGVRDGEESIDGDVDFVADDYGLHPVIYIEAKGHGIYGVRSKVSDSPPIFNQNRVTDWRGVNWSGLRYPPGISPAVIHDDWDDGIIYHYEGVADRPVGRSSRKSGPHNWQIAGYELVSIREMWDRRYDGLTFERFGVFDGDEGSDDSAKAPWGWDDRNDGPLYDGALFLEPARLIQRYFNGLGSFSQRYVAHSYK